MNSLRILDLIAMVEKTLGSRIPDRAVRLANFRTIATIVHAFHPDAAASDAGNRVGSTVRASRRPFAIRVANREHSEQRGDVTLSRRRARSPSAVSRSTVLRGGRSIPSRAGPNRSAPPSIATRASSTAAVLERAGQPSSRAIALGCHRTCEIRTPLAPAVCYHAYPELVRQDTRRRTDAPHRPRPLLPRRGRQPRRHSSDCGNSRCARSS